MKVVATTEQPIRVYDHERFAFVNEVLLMDGMTLPKNKQVPLLDSHNRDTVMDILGIFKNIEVNSDREVEGNMFFTGETEGVLVEKKIAKGLLVADIGYTVIKSTWIEEGKTKRIQGKEYAGPLKVVTKWGLKEVSVVPKYQ